MNHSTLVMGVLNRTPDSFSDGGENHELSVAVAAGLAMARAGAQIIDIGGESTRPGADRVPLAVEQERVMPLIKQLAARLAEAGLPAQISIDTMNAETAKAAVEAGAAIINDVSGGLADNAMFGVAAQSGARLVIGHWRGFSKGMDQLNNYESIAKDVADELAKRVAAALATGVSQRQIVLDPGLGFAKDAEQNWRLLEGLHEVEALGYPLLIGASRKRFLAAAINPADPASVGNNERDLATAELTEVLARRGVWGVRVHNVPMNIEAVARAQSTTASATNDAPTE